MADRPNPSIRSDFMAFQQHSTRWWDNDAYRHINNAVYYSFFDSAVNQILIQSGVLNIESSPVIGLVVETSCRYYAPIAFPDVIHTGVRVSKIGSSSVQYAIGLFRNDSDHASADGLFVHVYVDRITNKPQPIPHDTRKLLETLTAPR